MHSQLKLSFFVVSNRYAVVDIQAPAGEGGDRPPLEGFFTTVEVLLFKNMCSGRAVAELRQNFCAKPALQLNKHPVLTNANQCIGESNHPAMLVSDR